MKVLVGVFGSAGDLFPLVPALLRLQAEGHDVRCATSRSIGLYLRAIRIPTIAVGDGSELSVVRDASIFQLDDDGWSSWRQTVERYVLPSIHRDADAVAQAIGDWQPEVAVVSGFAAATRLVAHARQIPVVDVSIYPQHRAERVAAELALPDALGSEPPGGRAVELDAKTVWGAPADVLLFDPVLAQPQVDARSTVGFPAWDDVPAAVADMAAASAWAEGDGPRLLVTLGSFIGLAEQRFWEVTTRIGSRHGLRTLLVGARGSAAAAICEAAPGVTRVGFVPLSGLLPSADLVIHHGGLGTTMATLRAARPAVVVPQAFDQGANADAVEAHGLGRRSTVDHLEDRCADLLADELVSGRLEAMASVLRTSERATADLVDHVLRAGQS